MAEAFQVLLFGDETGDFLDPLQKLCERQKGVLFLHFVDRLNHVLHDEVRRHPRHVKKQIPPFTDVLDLVKQYQIPQTSPCKISILATCVLSVHKIMVLELQRPGTADCTC